MANIYYDADANLDALNDLTFAVVGYGNQGRAHALNLRDSGMTVIVGARPGGAAESQALKDGFQTMPVQDVAHDADVLCLLLPDEAIPSVYFEDVEPYLVSHKTFVFAHGFSIHHKTIRVPDDADILLVAPTGPGRQLRSLYLAGSGLPALIAVEQDASGLGFERCLAYARAIGCTRAGVIKTTFAEETVTDLYCEQAVLCGGVPELIKRSFATLVDAGYQPELAYISCLKEVKLIADLLFDLGIDGMRSAISTTAKFGSALTGPELIDSHTTLKLEKVLKRIESGDFAREFLRDAQEGSPTIKSLVTVEKHSKLAATGRKLKEEISF